MLTVVAPTCLDEISFIDQVENDLFLAGTLFCLRYQNVICKVVFYNVFCKGVSICEYKFMPKAGGSCMQLYAKGWKLKKTIGQGVKTEA